MAEIPGQALQRHKIRVIQGHGPALVIHAVHPGQILAHEIVARHVPRRFTGDGAQAFALAVDLYHGAAILYVVALTGDAAHPVVAL